MMSAERCFFCLFQDWIIYLLHQLQNTSSLKAWPVREAASPAQPSPVSIFYRVLLSAVPSAPSRTDSMSHFPSDFTPTDFLKELLDTWAHSFYTQKKPSLSSASGIPKSPGKRKNISLPLTSEMIQPGIPELPSLASAQRGCGIFPATCWLAGLQPGWMAPLSPNVFQSLLLLFRSLSVA